MRGVGRVICKGCGPELTSLLCYACGVEKLGLDFPRNERKQDMRKAYRRCWSCFTCDVCQKRHGDKTGFAPGKRHCFGCAPHRCNACEKDLRALDFDRKILDNAGRGSHKVCMNCADKGWTSKNLDAWTCGVCEKPRPYGDFEKQPERTPEDKRVCKDCQKTHARPFNH
jgi:hypothetical protein